MAKIVRKSVVKLLERLRGVLEYDQRSGKFKWLVERPCHGGKVRPGDIAGTIVLDRDGGKHIVIGVFGKRYRAHHLAWLFMTSEWPPKGVDIDHENGDRTKNRWTNLRLASRGQNNWNNHKLYATNKSGKRGVSWVAERNQWLVRVNVAGKPIHLGVFDKAKLSDAVKARRAGELKYFGHYAPK